MVRFAFTIADGPNAGLTSGGWRIWVRHEDTYITSKSIGGIWKVSLHGDIAWRLAVTKQHQDSPTPVWTEDDRAPWKFEPTPFVDGVRRAFFIAAFRGSLRRLPMDPRDTHVSVADRWDEVTLVTVCMTEPNVELDAPRRISEPLQLRSGRRVWLHAHTEDLEGGAEPEPEPVSSMVEPVWPGEHGVPVPGLVLRGVNVDSASSS
jgi:hypothetical protein